MDDVPKIVLEMGAIINSLKKATGELKPLAEIRATALSIYDKQIALTLIQLKNGIEFEIDGIKIVNPAVSVSEKMAKGICYKEKFNMEVADTGYKSLRSRMDCLRASLLGCQSMCKVVSESM